MKKLVLLAAVAAFSLPAQSFAAHHTRHHGAWNYHGHTSHGRHVATQRGMSRSGSASTEALNSRSLEQARGTMVSSASTTPPAAPLATATAPTATVPTVTAPTVTAPTATVPMATVPATTAPVITGPTVVTAPPSTMVR